MHSSASITPFLDIHKESTIQEAFTTVSDVVGDKGLNLLINNAGIYSTEDTCIEKVSGELMKDMFHIDVIGPALMCKVGWMMQYREDKTMSNTILRNTF